jgi:hypothetical protein
MNRERGFFPKWPRTALIKILKEWKKFLSSEK